MPATPLPYTRVSTPTALLDTVTFPQYSLLKMLELAALKSLQRASVDNEAKLKQASSDNFKPAWFQRVASDAMSLKTGT